jgi:hypothetical protein
MTLRYFAFVFEGRRWIELLITRANGRQVSQVPTGVTYKTARAAEAGVFAKNTRTRPMMSGEPR